jgi:hypothetical protein
MLFRDHSNAIAKCLLLTTDDHHGGVGIDMLQMQFINKCRESKDFNLNRPIKTCFELQRSIKSIIYRIII